MDCVEWGWDNLFYSSYVRSGRNGPYFIVAGDLDKDGKPDLAVTNYSSNDVTILLNRSGECIQAPSGLVSWWGGDNNALDMVSTNHGTVNSTTYASGLVGQAFSFDGVDDYVNVPYSSSLDLQSSLTISAWINSTNNSTQNRGIVGKSGGYQMFVEAGGLLDFGFYNGQWTLISTHQSIYPRTYRSMSPGPLTQQTEPCSSI